MQKQVAEVFNGHRVSLNRPSSSPAEPHADSLQLFLCRLGMLTADKGFPFPGLQQEPQWSSFVLCAPFGHLLYKWLCAHTWVPDEDSMSLLEPYFAFTVDVGWLVPVNVAPWVPEPNSKPYGFMRFSSMSSRASPGSPRAARYVCSCAEGNHVHVQLPVENRTICCPKGLWCPLQSAGTLVSLASARTPCCSPANAQKHPG